MSEILSEQEWEHWFGVLCRAYGSDGLYTAEEKLQLHERALRADRDRLAAHLAEVERERDEARRRCDEYVALRGWCGLENREGHIALVHGEEALMLAARSAAEPFAVYRRMGDLAASAPGGES